MPGPLDLLEALARQEVAITPTLRHVEVFTMRGLLTILWHGDPDAEAVVVVCGGAMGGLLGPADGFYQWLGDELATRGSGIGVLRVGWRRPNDIDLCTLDLLAAADLAARAGAERFVTGGPQLRRRHRHPSRDGDGRVDPRGGHLRHAVGRLRGGAGPHRAAARVPRRPRRDPAADLRARWWASWSAVRPTSGMCEGAGHLLTEAASGCGPRCPPGSASVWRLRVDVDAGGREEHGHPPLRRHHPVVLRPVVVLAAAGRGVDRRAAAPGGRRRAMPSSGSSGPTSSTVPSAATHAHPARQSSVAVGFGAEVGDLAGGRSARRRRRRAAR